MSEIARYQPVHEDAMVREDDGDYVKREDHEAAMRTLRGELNTASWSTLETVIDAMAKEFFADDKAEALSFANKAVKAAKKARTNPEEGA